MRVVFRFQKRGAVAYISHLDLLRTFNRALMRSGLPCQYTQGFHPHTVVSFAQALAVGMESVSEFVDVTFAQDVSPQGAMESLNAALTPGLRITGAWPVADAFKALMALVAGSAYCASPLQASAGLWLGLQERIDALLAAPAAPVLRRTAAGEKTVDIRPGIHRLYIAEGALHMLVSSGSANNVRPELVLQALGQGDAQWNLLRTQLYARGGGGLMRMEQIVSGEV